MMIKKLCSTTLLLWFLTAILPAQNPQPTLTLAEALDRGLGRAELKSIFEGRTALAESLVSRSRTWDNPQLYLSTEHTEAAGINTDENYLLVSQRIELFGIRKLRTQAARHKKSAVALENRSQRSDIAARIKERFFEALYYQKRVDILENWQSEIENTRRVIAKREKAGLVSGYDQRLLVRESSEALAVIARDRSFLAASREQLRALLATEETYSLEGDLLPSLPAEDASPGKHPRLLVFEEQIKAASLEERAASHWRLPEITVEAGLKNTKIGGTDDAGSFLSARVPLPSFNRNKSRLNQARARAAIARGEQGMALSEAEGRSRALNRQIGQLRTTIENYRQDVIKTSRELITIAEQAYRAGEMELLVLLDAHQGLRDAELKTVSMEAETRGLAIELERIGGVL